LRIHVLAIGLATLATSLTVLAHGDEAHPAPPFDPSQVEQKAFGRAGDPKKATRTVQISMGDTMRFWPAELDVKQGQTVLFVIRNEGKTMHELVLGTDQELAEHAEMMRKFPNMKHAEPYMAHVAPGRTEKLAWTFNRKGEFRFACLIPGHYESGMVGKVAVR
jgi:uncharacterized cupredoxin-like copper-binding protein